MQRLNCVPYVPQVQGGRQKGAGRPRGGQLAEWQQRAGKTPTAYCFASLPAQAQSFVPRSMGSRRAGSGELAGAGVCQRRPAQLPRAPGPQRRCTLVCGLTWMLRLSAQACRPLQVPACMGRPRSLAQQHEPQGAGRARMGVGNHTGQAAAEMGMRERLRAPQHGMQGRPMLCAELAPSVLSCQVVARPLARPRTPAHVHPRHMHAMPAS